VIERSLDYNFACMRAEADIDTALIAFAYAQEESVAVDEE
jgi:hypothetical protein